MYSREPTRERKKRNNNKENQMSTEEMKPRSRIVELGFGKHPDDMNQFDYMNLAYDCRLSRKAKHVLGYLAFRYNFKDRRPASMGQRRAANDLHIDRKTFASGVEQLVALGWVRLIVSEDPNETYNYELCIGVEDPSIRWTDTKAKNTQLMRDQRQPAKIVNVARGRTASGQG